MHVRPVRERVFLLIPKFANPARYLQPNILKISRVYICQNTYSTNKVRTLFVLSPKDSSREFFNIFPLLLSCPVCCKSSSSPRKIILSERLIRNERIDKNLLLRSLIFLFFLFFDWREDQTEKRQKSASFSCPSISKNDERREAPSCSYVKRNFPFGIFPFEVVAPRNFSILAFCCCRVSNVGNRVFDVAATNNSRGSIEEIWSLR